MMHHHSPRELWRPLLALILLAAAASPAQAEESVVGAIFELFGVAPAEPALPAVVAPAEVVADPDFANQYSPLLKKMLASEIRFLSKVCQPTPEQLNEIRQAGLAEVAVLSREFAQNQMQNRSTSEWPDARIRLPAALEKKVQEVLPEDAAKTYRKEIQARELARKDAALGLMVVNIDRKLALAPKQYDRVYQTIDLSWNPQWGRNLQVFLYEDYAPRPDARILRPVLNERQQAIWTDGRHYGTISFGWEQDVGWSPFGNIAEGLQDEDLEAAEVAAEVAQ